MLQRPPFAAWRSATRPPARRARYLKAAQRARGRLAALALESHWLFLLRFEPANKAFFEGEDFATDLNARWSNAFGMASLKGAFAHAEIFCGLSFRHATKTRIISHAENRFAVSKKVKQPDGLPNGRSYARVSRDMMLAISVS